MDKFRAMQVFVNVVGEGSFTAAAAKSGITPTMVGNHIQALEQELGTRLLHRTTRRQHLTEFGRAYHERCVDILAAIADADALALEEQAAPRGILRITAPATFGTECLVPSLFEFMARYPEVEVDIVLSDVILDLVDNGLEAAIRLGPLPDSGMIARPLMAYRMLICASPAYLRARGTPTCGADLAGHECLAFKYAARSEWHHASAEWRIHGPNGAENIKVSGRLRVDSAHALRRAAVNSMGIVMLPEVLLLPEIEAGRLMRLLPDYQLPSRPLHLVYMPDRLMSPKLRSFVEFVLMRFGPRSPDAGGSEASRHAFPLREAAGDPALMTAPSVASATGSRTCSPSSRTGDASPLPSPSALDQ